ncbi:MAG: hypothetical protein AB4041_07510 [Microcystaceae cyanobacterium]
MAQLLGIREAETTPQIAVYDSTNQSESLLTRNGKFFIKYQL